MTLDTFVGITILVLIIFFMGVGLTCLLMWPFFKAAYSLITKLDSVNAQIITDFGDTVNYIRQSTTNPSTNFVPVGRRSEELNSRDSVGQPAPGHLEME